MRCLKCQGGLPINADVMTRQFRIEMMTVSDEKNTDHFFASMAEKYSLAGFSTGVKAATLGCAIEGKHLSIDSA